MIWWSDVLMFWWSATWPSPHLSTAVAQHARKMVGKKVRKEVDEIILNFFRHSKPERGGNILDQGFISLDAQDSIGSTSQNWWPTKPTPHVSLPSDALINVGHKSSFSQSHQTRPANVTEPQVKVVEKEASSRQAAGRKSVAAAAAAGRKSGTAGWEVPVATETDAGRLLAHRWAIPPSRKYESCLRTNTEWCIYTNTRLCLHHSHAQIHRDSCINTDFLSWAVYWHNGLCNGTNMQSLTAIVRTRT